MNTTSIAEMARQRLEAERMALNQCVICGVDLPAGSLEVRCFAHEEPVALLCEVDGDGQWGVWIGLSGENPITSPFGFCAGTGATKDEALARAVLSLQAACDTMQRGDVAQYERPARREF